MSLYRVIDIATGQQVYAYKADAPIEWHGMEFATHNHVVVPDASQSPESPVPAPLYGGRRRLTKQEFITLLGGDFQVILAASKQSIAVESWVLRFQIAEEAADGTSMNLDDSILTGGLAALESAGVIAAGRAEEILRG